MASSQKAKIAFIFALVLLVLSGTAAGLAILRLYRAEALVRHTYDIEVALGDLEYSLSQVGRARVTYADLGTPETLQDFLDAVPKVYAALARIRQLTRDNPSQQALCDRLDSNADERMAPSKESVELKHQNKFDPQKELQINYAVARAAFDTFGITREMRQNEDRLLRQRSHLSEILFVAIPGIVAVSFLLSACMFWLHYRLLNRELRERKSAENQLRQLSLELMRVQDEEHRRFARELHDGLGQTLATAKMLADVVKARNPQEGQIADLSAILGEALSDTRTISHLFHPPFLDEIGFASAARWLIEGYEKRTGVSVSMVLPRPEQRLPRILELTLYRILQEALNNIHRHARSAKAEVMVRTDPEWVALRVRDYGVGIPGQTFDGAGTNGKQPGVGLTGMKERVQEQGGTLEVRSDETGTEIVVRIPVTSHMSMSLGA